MFYGESTHSLDDKGRAFVPKRFQEVLRREGEEAVRVVLTRGFEGCVFLFTEDGFEEVMGRLLTQAFGGEKLRKMQRLFFANTHRCQLEKSGRLLIPEKLKKFAKLDSDVVMVGVADRAEIWDRKAWEAFESENEEDFDQLDVVLIGDGAAPNTGGDGGASPVG